MTELEKVWSERNSLERKEIASAIKQIRQKNQQEVEKIIAERWKIRRIGRQQLMRVNGNELSRDSDQEILDPRLLKRVCMELLYTKALNRKHKSPRG